VISIGVWLTLTLCAHCALGICFARWRWWLDYRQIRCARFCRWNSCRNQLRCCRARIGDSLRQARRI
jgi:hypothetical protein